MAFLEPLDKNFHPELADDFAILEDVPTEMGEKILKQGGWDGKRHKS